MSKVGRNSWVAIERPDVIGVTAGYRESMLARAANQRFIKKLEEQRTRWKLKPPSPIVLELLKDAGEFPAGLVLSVPHEVGRVLLHRRWAAILEHDVTVDAVIDGGLEEAVAAMGLSPAFNESAEVAA